ncbi:hypothetical protein ABZT03_43825 [Streptomyces sp. NPDC005574]|uniref:hypothetical protein n=1 Tax=Streptomyces sp. NPDC005574 TaxID=3156891 RepID=UPI0033A8D53D
MYAIARNARHVAIAALASSALIGISMTPSFAQTPEAVTSSAWQPPIGMSFSGTGSLQVAAMGSADTAMTSWAADYHAN